MVEEYSVWALPPAEIADRIRSVMSALRSEFGGPEFEPHITLVRATRHSRESATRKLRSASGNLSPYAARIAAVSGRQLIYETTPEMMETSALCCKHFGYEYSRPYRPHSSLLYSNLTEEESAKVQKRAEELSEKIVGLTFEVSSICLTKTDTKDKSLKSWEIIEITKLQ